jgi:predicted fused transcriptional regulator/phosphomethylpyrimidine kinase/predicted XRE-type DNA-binding protein
MAEEVVLIRGEKKILLKKAIAQNLYKNKFEQLKISRILGLTQPMVSNYLSSNEKIPKNIKKIAENITNRIIEKSSIKFQTCISFSDNEYEGTYYIANKNEIINEENSKIVDNLTQAFYILKNKYISGLIPEIKINLAMSKEKPTCNEDIASFSNGLILSDKSIVGFNGIRFGSSKHLSTLLLKLRDTFDVSAIMNIAYSKILLTTDLSIGYLTKDYDLKKKYASVDVLLHNGDFGIEPCSYVIGKDAVDVAKKVLQIRERIKSN